MYVVITNQTIAVGTVAIKLPTIPLVGRDYIFLTNLDTANLLYVGNVNIAVTGSNRGTLVQPYGSYYGEWTDKVDIYGITSINTIAIAVEEGK